MRKKIVYLTHTAKMGGAEKSLYNLIKNIDYNLYEPILICGEEGDLTNVIRNIGVKTEIIPMKQINTKFKLKGIFRLFRGCFYIRKFILQNDVYLIHNNTYRARFFGTIAGKLAKVKVVTHVRDIMKWSSVEKLMPYIEDNLIAISDAVKEHILNQINHNQNKVIKIYNGVDTNEFNPNILRKKILRKEYRLNKDDIILGAIGRFDEWKRFDIFIEAANMLRYNENLKFFIIGEAFSLEQESIKKNLINMVEKLGLNKSIIFTGYRKNIAEVMNDIDIFILTSDNEPFGRVLIEALSLNIPIISTNNGGAPEIIKDNINGVLISPNNSQDLAKKIETLLKNIDLIKYMKANNRKYVIDNFSIENHVRLVSKIYNELLNDKEK